MRTSKTGYLFRQRPCDSRFDEECSQTAADIFRQWKAVRADERTVSQVAHGPTASIAMTAMMQRLLESEARRRGISKPDQPKLAEDAVEYADWACTSEVGKNSLQAIARFAVAAAYDRTQQMLHSSVIDDTYPTKWWSVEVVERFRRKRVLRAVGDRDQGFGSIRLAFFGRGAMERLERLTSEFVIGKVAPVNIHPPYLGLKAHYGWALDPLRPPMSGVRFVASLIETYRGHGPKTIIAVEPGLTATMQALAWFLPQTEVYGASAVLAEMSVERPGFLGGGKADAAVVNLPNLRSMALMVAARKASRERDRPLDREEIDRIWKVPVTDAIENECIELLEIALDHLADDGLLVVLGDVDSGIHHHAVAHVGQQEDLDEVKAAPATKPIRFGYTKPPWAPFGGLPGTDRLVSAWMRLAP